VDPRGSVAGTLAAIGVNVSGFFRITQLAVEQMLRQGSGHLVQISTSLVDHADASVNSVLASLTKGGPQSATHALGGGGAGVAELAVLLHQAGTMPCDGPVMTATLLPGALMTASSCGTSEPTPLFQGLQQPVCQDCGRVGVLPCDQVAVLHHVRPCCPTSAPTPTAACTSPSPPP
jgi:hypothetical protein